MKYKLTLIPAVVLTTIVLTAGTSQARDTELVRMAHQIESIGRELKNEFQTHYSRSSAYRHLLSDANLLISKADHIDRLSHDPRTSYLHLRTDLTELDRLATHLHEVVDDVDRGRYSGWVDRGLGHVHAKLDMLNDSIRRMIRLVDSYNAPRYDDCPYSRTHYSNSSLSTSWNGSRYSSYNSSICR
ncbi:MAG: hypothetical protein P1U89_02795 [Verrucomicrobiales bacterium]|nr:hypothetical protein [Verrucomicrobiales bacterium]